MVLKISIKIMYLPEFTYVNEMFYKFTVGTVGTYVGTGTYLHRNLSFPCSFLRKIQRTSKIPSITPTDVGTYLPYLRTNLPRYLTSLENLGTIG